MDIDNDTDIQSSTSRKRPYNSLSTISSMSPSYKVKSEMSTNSTNQSNNNNNNNSNDEHKVWQEISTFIPLLTYGEESIDLLNGLLCLPFAMAVRDAEDCIDSLDCKREMVSVEDVHKRKEVSLSNLARVLNNMLHVRSVMGRRGSVNMQQQQQATKSMSTPSKKKQKIKEEKSSPSKSTTEVANKKDVDILPWNVLLRITIRMTAHVVNQLNGCNTSAAAGKKQEDDEHEQDKRGEANVHPLLQVLDIVSGSLHLLTRMQKQHLQQQSQESDQNETEAKITTPTKKKRASAQPPSVPQTTNNKAQLPKDRMIHDWKSNYNKLKSPSRLSPTGREIWGPSRYSFLKDVDSITQLLKVDNDASNIMGINHDEWYERINSIVQVLDECVKFDQLLQFGNDVSPIQHHESGGQLQQSTALGISPSLLRYGNKSSINNGTPKSPSLASITKAHVERMSAQKEADRESCKKKLAFASSKLADEQVSGGVSVNLQAMMNKESHYPVKMEEGAEEESEKYSELVDAYRMAIIFGSSGSGGEQDTARETIERRLTILVHEVNTSTTEEEKLLRRKETTILNVDGALSYLETLLRTLIKPQDSNVWFKLLSKSDGKETPIMLRRGRSSLISFLIGIKSPGWQEADNQLISSPVPSYLGYLSCSEDAVQPSNKAKGQQGIHHRSSYFLPAVGIGETTLPPSPAVTEVGLSMCTRNFLHKDTPTGSISSQQPLSKRSSGVCIFKNFEPIQTSSSTNMSDDILNSIETTPLSDVNELTRDLFDLILRLAADDDVDHENKPFPLRLTTSSPSESLNIVLNVLSEHLDWLSPHSITSRYRFVLTHVMQSFPGDNVSSDLVEPDDGDEEGGREAWSKRASYLIDATKTSSQGQMALYTTQFMMLLCSRGKGNTLKSSFPGSTKQSHFYTCLQLRQSSQFWNEIDNSVDDYSSNIMTRVLDKEFALQFLLPLSHRCALLLASSTPSLSKNTSSHYQDNQSMQSLITILSSVLDVVADDGHLQECNHMGWALQILALTINHFTFSGVEGVSNTGSYFVWEDISRQLNRLYFSVWGQDWQSLHNYQSQTNKSNQDYILYEAIDDHSGTRMVVLMPCFDVFVVSLVKFVCNLKVESNEDIKRFCTFVARVMFDRYEHVLQSSSNSSKDVPRVEHKWIALLASTLQDMCSGNSSNESLFERNRDNKADDDDRTTDQALADLITPALKCLHMLIIKRVLKTSSSRQETTSQLPESVASIFVVLHQQESEKFIKKPSSVKTRRWGVYRKCLEQVFTLTPTSVLFAYHGNPALTEHSANVLETIWNQYGQCELSHSISILVAAALHVNASAASLRSDSPSSMGRDDSSQHLKQLYDIFSSQAKDCIINTFQCFKAEQKIKHQSLDDSQTDINGLIRFVRIELSHQSKADVGLSWWNEVSSDLLSSSSPTPDLDSKEDLVETAQQVTKAGADEDIVADTVAQGNQEMVESKTNEEIKSVEQEEAAKEVEEKVSSIDTTPDSNEDDEQQLIIPSPTTSEDESSSSSNQQLIVPSATTSENESSSSDKDDDIGSSNSSSQEFVKIYKSPSNDVLTESEFLSRDVNTKEGLDMPGKEEDADKPDMPGKEEDSEKEIDVTVPQLDEAGSTDTQETEADVQSTSPNKEDISEKEKEIEVAANDTNKEESVELPANQDMKKNNNRKRNNNKKKKKGKGKKRR